MASRKRTIGKSNKPVPPRRAPTPRGVDRDKKAIKPTEREPRRRIAEAAPADPLLYARSLVREVPDFPKPGIGFKDITPLVADPKGLHIVLDALLHRFVGERIDAVVGIESRGFIFGGALAARLNAGFVPVRKAGKLPYRTDRVSYALEYGQAEVEIHRDALRNGSRVIIVDDLLATGGTAAATQQLVARQGAVVAAHAFVIELGFLAGRKRLEPTPVFSLIRYD